MNSALSTAVAPPVAKSESRRIVSVDALRGFDMFWIIGGDVLAQALKKMSAAGSGVVSSIGGQFPFAFKEV